MVRIKAYAKINLTLEIVGEENGYHRLDSLVGSVDLFDLITLKKRKDKLSAVTMKGMGSEQIPPENNNALKAAEAFSKKDGSGGAQITVYKNIPMGAGLGGSSADVAGVLLGMAKLYGIDDEKGLAELADTLGSDCRYMLSGGFARMQGRGNLVTPLDLFSELYFLAICPQSDVLTKECYKRYDQMGKPQSRIENATENCIAALSKNDVNAAGRYLTNDLFAPATALNSDVLKAYEEALSFSPLGAVMTGSGSCVLALFETRELCDWAKSRYKGKFRTYVFRTVKRKDKKLSLKNPFVLSDEEIESAIEK